MDGNHRHVGVGNRGYSRFGDQRRLAQTSLEERLIEAELPGFFKRVRSNAARDPFAVNLAVGVLVAIFKLEQILRDDYVAFHTDYLGNLCRAA